MDIAGCPECPNGMQGDIRDLSRFRAGQFGSVYVAHVLEVIPFKDIKKTFEEVTRVADQVYIAHLPADTLSAALVPGVQTIIHSAPPTTPDLVYSDVRTGERKIAHGTI